MFTYGKLNGPKDGIHFSFFNKDQTSALDPFAMMDYVVIPEKIRKEFTIYTELQAYRSRSFMSWIASIGDIEMMDFLLRLGIDKNKKGDNPLYWAVGFGKMDMVKFLIENGFDCSMEDAYALIVACGEGNLEMVKFLIGNGCCPTSKNNEPLKKAIASGQLEIVRFFLENYPKQIPLDFEDNAFVKLSHTTKQFHIRKYFFERGVSPKEIISFGSC